MRTILIITILAAVQMMTPGLVAAQDDSGSDLANLTVYTQLAAAREFLDRLPHEEIRLERQILIRSAIDALTSLYQLYGCEWAGTKLVELHELPDCPELIIGYTPDGRLRLQIEQLELKNPAFREYTFYLVTLNSQSALLLENSKTSNLQFTTHDGETLTADQITPDHQLWPQLERMAATYLPVSQIPPGGGWSFKQVFGMEITDTTGIGTVLLEWGEYEIQLPRNGILELKQDG